MLYIRFIRGQGLKSRAERDCCKLITKYGKEEAKRETPIPAQKGG